MKIETLLSQLERVRKSQTGWTACCPGHKDATPSLSITLGDDGRILLKCFAGCELPTIVGALEIAVYDLFAGPALSPAAPEAVYQYRDERGEVLFEVVRGPGKRFRQRRPDGHGGWLWNLAGVRRVLYRLPARREKLFNYVLRPPIAQEHVTLTDDGLVALKLKRPFRDGTVFGRDGPSVAHLAACCLGASAQVPHCSLWWCAPRTANGDR